MKKTTLLDVLIKDRTYRVCLEVYDRITIVTGDSGVGKSCLFGVIDKIAKYGALKNAVCIKR